MERVSLVGSVLEWTYPLTHIIVTTDTGSKVYDSQNIVTCPMCGHFAVYDLDDLDDLPKMI